MSKERLGFDVDREMKHLKKIVNKDDSLTLSSRFVKYLIEQAERLEELGNELYNLKESVTILKQAHKICSVEKTKSNYKINDLVREKSFLEQQNKRYRELLTSKSMKQLIRLEDKGCFLPDEGREGFLDLKYAIEALEDES